LSLPTPREEGNSKSIPKSFCITKAFYRTTWSVQML
jgi:hypothetical protein